MHPNGCYFVFLLLFCVIMSSDIRYGVPYEQSVDVCNGNDIDYEYRWFDTMDAALAFAATLGDPGWDVANMILECGGVHPNGYVAK